MSLPRLKNETTPDDEATQRQALANQGLIELLNAWAQPTEEERREQRETWDYLRRALDEDRPDGAKLFR